MFKKPQWTAEYIELAIKSGFRETNLCHMHSLESFVLCTMYGLGRWRRRWYGPLKGISTQSGGIMTKFTVRYGNLWKDGFASLVEAEKWAQDNVKGFYRIFSYSPAL